MSPPAPGARARAGTRIERLQHWIAGLASALLHALLLLLAMSAEPLVPSSPQGSAGGGRIEVTWVDEDARIPSPPETPPAAPAPDRAPPRPDPAPPSGSRLQVVEVEQAPEPLPSRSDAPRDAAAASASRRHPVANRPRHVWGQPPGMLPEQHAAMNAGTAPTPDTRRGRRYNASATEASMEAGGYQVLYDVLSEQRMRDWRDEGITEVYLPLPGTRRYMVCPLETALRRESGPCRLLEPDDPELAAIGDARKVITMERVYRRGELLWRGPGAYR